MTHRLQCLRPMQSDWHHRWVYVDDPFIQYLKGPLKAPMIAVPFPVVVGDNKRDEAKDCDCAKNIRESYDRIGIPDPHEDFIILSREGKDVTQFPKRDTDVAHFLNDNHQHYLGQGIPDPWRRWMYIDLGNYDHADLRKDFKDYLNKIRFGPGTGLYRTELVRCPNCGRRLVILCVSRSDSEQPKPEEPPVARATVKDACVETDRPPPEPCRCKVDKACYFQSHHRERRRSCKCNKRGDGKTSEEDLLTLLKHLQNLAQIQEEKPPVKEKSCEKQQEPAVTDTIPENKCNRFEVNLTCGKCEKRPKRKPRLERCSSEEKPDYLTRHKCRPCFCDRVAKCHCNDNSDQTCCCSRCKFDRWYPDTTIPVRLQLASPTPRYFGCGKIYDRDLSQLLELFGCDDLRRNPPADDVMPKQYPMRDPVSQHPRPKPKHPRRQPCETLDRTLRNLNREHLYDSQDWKNNEFVRQRTAMSSSVVDLGARSTKPASRGYTFDEHVALRNLLKRQRKNNQFRKQLRYYMAISRNEVNQEVSSTSSPASGVNPVDNRRRPVAENPPKDRYAPTQTRITSPRRDKQPRKKTVRGLDHDDEEEDTP